MFKMILAKQYLAIAFRLSLVALVLISQSTVNLHAQEEGPEPPPGGQGGGGTGGTGGAGNGGGQSVGGSGVTSSTINNGSGNAPGGIGNIIPCTNMGIFACNVACTGSGSSSLSTGGGSGGDASCKSCGSGGGASGKNDDDGRRLQDFSANDVKRLWIPNDRAHNSSFSPGFYNQFDSQMHLFSSEGGNSIYFFDVFAERTFKFVDGLDGDTLDGVFHD